MNEETIQPNSEKIKGPPSGPKGQIRGIWAVTIIVAVAILVGGLIWFLVLYDTINIQGVLTPKFSPSVTPTQTAGSSPTATACASEALTAEEKAITEDWETHTNTAGRFEFKHPSGWTVTQEYVDMVKMQNSVDPNEQFEFRRGEAAHVDTSGYTNTNTVDKKVWCIEATEKIYEKGNASPFDYLVVVEFERYNNINYLVYRFKAEGASIAGDYIDQFNALIKTFKFL